MNLKFKHYVFAISVMLLIGCGPKIVITEEPTIISNIQIEAEENCDIGRR